MLSREDYRIGRDADLIPSDLTLGWGRMSDEQVFASIDVTQSGGSYFWSTPELPIPRCEIETNRDNMHINPDDAYVELELSNVRKG